MVAKSFQNYETVTDVYEVGGKKYIKVRHPNTGNVRQVRWYTDKEYAKLYPGEIAASAPVVEDKLAFNAKKALGFEKGYITIFKGDTYPYLDWFKLSNARYHDTWGWYIVSTEEVPENLPPTITAVQLKWEDVSSNGALKPQTAIREVVEALLYEESPSEHQGSIGDRLERTLTVKKAITSDGYYGTSTMHIMEDADENIYIWATAAKSWQPGEVHKIRGTVKEHKLYKNQKQTVLTRCVCVDK